MASWFGVSIDCIAHLPDTVAGVYGVGLPCPRHVSLLRGLGPLARHVTMGRGGRLHRGRGNRRLCRYRYGGYCNLGLLSRRQK